MKKSSLFITAGLITFMLAVTIGTINTYRAMAASSTQPVASAQPAAQGTATPAPVTATASLTPQQAVQLADSYIGRTDASSVEGGYLDDMYVYKVIFVNGEAVYVNLNGQVLGVENGSD